MEFMYFLITERIFFFMRLVIIQWILEREADEDLFVPLDKTFRVSIRELGTGKGFASPVIISLDVDLIFARFINLFEGEILAFLEVFEADGIGVVGVRVVHGFSPVVEVLLFVVN